MLRETDLSKINSAFQSIKAMIDIVTRTILLKKEIVSLDKGRSFSKLE